jgi:hypothetical protein
MSDGRDVGDDNQSNGIVAAQSMKTAQALTSATQAADAAPAAIAADGKYTNDFDEDEIVVKFDPSDVDVVSTKIRTWNAKHPGNMFYADLVAQTVSSGKDLTPPFIREAAKGIYEILTVQRGGRFLKLPERVSTSEYCTLLTPKRCVEKIIHAIKTSIHKIELREKGVTQPYKKEKKGIDGSSQSKSTTTKSKSPTPTTKTPKATTNLSTNPGPSLVKKTHKGPDKTPAKSFTAETWSVGGGTSPTRFQQSPTANANRLALLPFSFAYEAVAGNQPVHWYGLKAVSVICSQSDPWTAFQALDVPCGVYTTETEPERERLMRLQVRP